MNLRQRLCFMVGLGRFLAAAQADVLLEDGFDYTDGPVTAVAGERWRHHSGGTEDMRVVLGALHLAQKCSEDVNALLAGQPYGPDSSVALYARWMLQMEQPPAGASGGYFAHFKDAANGFRGRIFATTNGAAAGKYRLGVSASAGAASAMHPRELDFQISYCVVLRYDVGTAQTSLWIDPETEEDVHASSGDDASPLAITALAFRQSLSGGNGIGTLSIDDLVVGQSFHDVTGGEPPEPAVPEILIPPCSQSVAAGTTVRFSVVARGTEPLAFQWYFQSTLISGATNASLTLESVGSEHSGIYSVTVSNSLGTVDSPGASLTVEIEPIASPPDLSFTNLLNQLVRPGDLGTNRFTEISLHPGEELTVQVYAQSTDRQPCGLRLLTEDLPASATWESLQGGGLEAVGRFRYAPTREDFGRQLFIKIAAETPLASRELMWTLYVPTETEQALILTEFLANPSTDASSPRYNPLGRPIPSQRPALEDEYLEWVNFGGAELDVSGWTIEDAQQLRHLFPSESRIPPLGAIVIYGGPKAEPLTGDGFLSRPASEGAAGLSLNNTGTEWIILRNANHQLIARMVYTDNDLSSESSLCRWPARDGAFIPHHQAGPLVASPGRTAEGKGFDAEEPEPVAIGKLRIERLGGGSWQLAWDAVPGRQYSVWAADQIAGPYREVARELGFGDGDGRLPISLGPETPAVYYRLSAP
ncbi:MAG TPA: lamin tail domain-containing protein [Candidatus Paceibacterota bacterium]|nr:lamin tail domain-containing protein [Verrucomicrobiota bacterium]HRY47410.1 lamin tail domain-containing protein [Candidatus Paceibacterota bacterium]